MNYCDIGDYVRWNNGNVVHHGEVIGMGGGFAKIRTSDGIAKVPTCHVQVMERA